MYPKNDNHFKTFITGSAISFIGVISLGIINYFTRRILALNLSQTEFGFFYSAYSLISLFLVFLDIGLGYSLTILIAKYSAINKQKKINSIISVVLFIKLVLGICVCVFLLLISNYLLYNYFHYSEGYLTFIIISFLCVTSTLSGTINSVLTGFKNFFQANLFINIQNIILLGIVLLLVNKLKSAAPSLGVILGTIIVSVIGGSYLRNKFKIKFIFRYSLLKEAWRETWGMGKWIAFGLAGISVMYYMDTIMLTWLTNLKEVALYNIALPIMQIFQSLIIFPTVFIPIASTLWQQGNKKQIGELTNGFITLITFLCWGIFIFTMILGKDIITILFSTRYTDASTALVILCVGIAFFALSQFFIGTLNSIEKTKQSALIILVGLIINLTLNYILIPILGLNGAATATAISYFIVSIISYIQLRHNIPNLTLDIKRTILCCIAGLFCTACMLFFNYISYTLLDRILFTGILGFIFLILTLPASIPIIVLIKNIKLQK